jgi:hypothetical protein
MKINTMKSIACYALSVMTLAGLCTQPVAARDDVAEHWTYHTVSKAGRVGGSDLELAEFVFDSFKDCTAALRYDESTKKLDNPLFGWSKKKSLVTVKDGYATIHLRAIHHGLRISQVVIPTRTNTFLQYRMRIEAQPARVRGTLQRTWNVQFAQSGPDGMDNKVGSAYRILEGAAQVRLFADSEKSKTTILECNP